MHLSTRVVEICNFSHHYFPTRVAEPVVLLSACGVKFFFVLRVCTVNIWHERTNPTGSYCCIDIVTCYSRTKQDLYQQQRKCQPCTRRAFMKLHLYLRFCTICRMRFPSSDSALRRWIRCWIPSGILHHQPSGSQGLLTFFKAIKVRSYSECTVLQWEVTEKLQGKLQRIPLWAMMHQRFSTCGKMSWGSPSIVCCVRGTSTKTGGSISPSAVVCTIVYANFKKRARTTRSSQWLRNTVPTFSYARGLHY